LGGFRRGNGFAHEEQFDDADGDYPIDQHRQEGRPFENAACHFCQTKDREEWGGEDVGCAVNETGKSGRRIGTQKFQDETESEQDFQDSQKVPDDLSAAIEGLGAGGGG